MENSFKNIIEPASSILILLPANPLMDEVSSALSLFLGLKDKKLVTVSCPTPMKVEYSRLVGVDKVSTQLGNKNLNISFSNYPPDNIERVSYDVEEGKFKLSVIPKTGFNAPEKEKINIDYAGVEADIVLLVGGDKESDFPVLKDPQLQNLKVVHLGAKLLEGKTETQMISLATASSSIAEIVANRLKEMGVRLDADLATNLLTGIEYGSRYFQVEHVNAETFKLFAELLNLGGQRLKKPQKQNYPQGAVPQQPYNQPVAQQPTAQVVKTADQKQKVDDNQQIVEAVVPATAQAVTENKDAGEVPESWIEPKVYTGTSVN